VRQRGPGVGSDGHESHRTRAAFERDRARDAELTALGWRVVRFAHRQAVRDPERVGGLLAELLAQPDWRSISSTR
jgi:very-short-patch-repair endonuclease